MPINFEIPSILLLLSLAFALAVPVHAGGIPRSWQTVLNQAEENGSSQLLLVLTNKPQQFKASVHCLEKRNGVWQFAMPPMSASVGRNGIADPGQKREGDGMSPAGIFPIGMAFGYDEECATKMPYQQMFADDIWVDDPAAADYNRLTKVADSLAKSYEFMRRRDELYRQGLVVEYNTNPVVAGHGSAIFIHFWGRAFNSTSGCLGLPKKHLQTLLGFLAPDKNPQIGFFRKDQLK